MGFIGTQINQSPVIVLTAGEEIKEPAFKAVTVNEDGAAVLSATGDVPMGIVTAEYEDADEGDDLTVQIKDCGLWTVGEDVTVGAELAAGADGKAAIAASGDFIVGFALQAAAANEVASVQICKSGYKA